MSKQEPGPQMAKEQGGHQCHGAVTFSSELGWHSVSSTLRSPPGLSEVEILSFPVLIFPSICFSILLGYWQSQESNLLRLN